jgi:hypothetical protein
MTILCPEKSVCRSCSQIAHAGPYLSPSKANSKFDHTSNFVILSASSQFSQLFSFFYSLVLHLRPLHVSLFFSIQIQDTNAAVSCMCDIYDRSSCSYMVSTYIYTNVSFCPPSRYRSSRSTLLQLQVGSKLRAFPPLTIESQGGNSAGQR